MATDQPAERLAREESPDALLERVKKFIGQTGGNKVAHVAEVDAFLGGPAEQSGSSRKRHIHE